MFTSEDIILVSYQFSLVGLNVEGKMNVEPSASPFTNPLVFAHRTRVKLAQVESVDRDVENSWVFVKDLGCPIAYMNIPVKDENFLHIELFLCDASRDSNVVDEAETSD